jgi:ketosteroid isomerase-like protein
MRYAYLMSALFFSLHCCKQPEQHKIIASTEDTKKVKKILETLDVYGKDINATMDIFTDDVVHMAQGKRATTNKEELQQVLTKEAGYGETIMKHTIIEIHSYSDMVLTRGKAIGTWAPPNGASIPFETNNVITFRRSPDGGLKVWHVIFNRVTLEDYK